MPDRKELYILDKGGQMLFHYSTKVVISENEDNSKFLTASYISGILKFAEAASGNIISNFEMGKLTIWLKKGENLPLYYIFIVGKEKSIKEKKINKYINQIVKDFEELYTLEEINSWDGSTDYFDFTGNVKKILKIH
ncbi:MAG: hypothetical protein ACTSVU_06060 [Promethearchaeota archaeon]